MPGTELSPSQPTLQPSVRNSTNEEDETLADGNTISVGDIHGSPTAPRGEPEMQISNIELSSYSP